MGAHRDHEHPGDGIGGIVSPLPIARVLIGDKRQGRDVVVESEPSEATGVVDLMAALRRSVVPRTGGKNEGWQKKPRPREVQPGLSTLNKSELDRMARELGVNGRSKMNRKQREAAVSSAADEHQTAS